MDKEKLSQDILDLVGGQSNIDQVTHCMTRLRFNLNDDNLANKAQLEKTPGVMGVMKNGGQFQVIIGNEVANVYKELVKKIPGAGQNEGASASKPKKKQNPISRLFDFISGMFTPILPAIIGAGMIKGIVAILLTLGWMSDTSSTYIILSAIGDGAFYFLPIILAVSAARKLGSNMYIAAAIAAGILHPTITTLLSAGTPVTFANIPVIAATYSSSVIPIVIAIWLASYVEKAVDRVTHASLKLLIVPTVTLLVMVPVTLIAVGPLGTILGNGLSGGITWLFENTGLLAGLLIGGTMSLLIITGMHYALIPVMFASIASLGYDYLIPLMFAANIAQAGATFGVFLKSKVAKTKTLSLSTTITALMGITEPAMYGVNMKYKKPFIAALIGGGVGGAFISLFQGKAFLLAGLVGLSGIPMFIGPTFVYVMIGVVIAFAVAAGLTYILGFAEEVAPATPVATSTVEAQPAAASAVAATVIDIDHPVVHQAIATDIFSPVAGEVKPLSAVNDPAFSQEIMGKGVAIEPTEGRIVSPVNGTVFSVSKSGHAIGLVSDTGTEMLIHIGIDTVKLKGKHFTPHAKAGETVKIGDLLMEFDLAAVRGEGYETITPVIVTNINEYNDLQPVSQSNTQSGELLYRLS